MDNGVESRFERYADVIVEALGHADRAAPARWYLRGLMLPGERKSVEPMAARVHPEDVRSAHQSMHHLVASSEWSDRALLAAVAGQVVPVLSEEGQLDRSQFQSWLLLYWAWGESLLILNLLQSVDKWHSKQKASITKIAEIGSSAEFVSRTAAHRSLSRPPCLPVSRLPSLRSAASPPDPVASARRYPRWNCWRYARRSPLSEICQ